MLAPFIHDASRSVGYSEEVEARFGLMPDGGPTMHTTTFLSTQDIYDIASRHLIDQMRVALMPHGGAAYRGYGCGCPVGKFIPPLFYCSSMEGVPVGLLMKPVEEVPLYMEQGLRALRRALIKGRVNVYDDESVLLLCRLQTVHDAFGPWEWKRRLRAIASEFSLHPRVYVLERT